MAVTIDYNAVKQLQDLSISREDAIECLKACNNDVNQAAEYYWNGDLEKARKPTQWDESAWTLSDSAPFQPDHNYSNNWSPEDRSKLAPPSFQIHSSDVYPDNSRASGTKSRPPSRTSMRRGDENDPELAEALAASMRESGAGNFGGQEIGVALTRNSPTNPNFAPAQENKVYDPSQWAMTTTQTQEITPELLPQDRARSPKQPVFLKPHPAGEYIAGIITIIHSIPGVRRGLLGPKHIQKEYGHNDRWWAGKAIATPKIIDLESGQSFQASEPLGEVQRLMAFLDESDRAYGSVEYLVRITLDAKIGGSSSLIDFFTVQRRAMLEVEPEARGLLWSQACQINPQGEMLKTQEFGVFELNAGAGVETLYTAFDSLIFSDGKDSVYVDFGNVLTIKLSAGDDEVGLEIPFQFYPDRYTKDWVGIAKDLKKKMTEHEQTLVNVEYQRERLTRFESKDTRIDRDGRVYDPRELLEIAINHFSVPLPRVTESDEPDDFPIDSQPLESDTARMLKETYEKIQQKLGELAELRKVALDSLAELKSLYTIPGRQTPNNRPLTRFSLRGVCTDVNTTFVLSPSIKDSPTEEQDAFTPFWWRFLWRQTSAWSGGTFEVSQVFESEVQDAAKSAQEVVLVYAKDSLLEKTEREPLPEALQAFIDRDNAAFAAELGQEAPERKRRPDWLEGEFDEDDGRQGGSGGVSPKQVPAAVSTQSSATIGTPAAEPVDRIVSQTIELPARPEMEQRDGYVSPVAKAFHLASDTDMPDAPDVPTTEHAEYVTEGRKGG